jgi:hypothetical protein
MAADPLVIPVFKIHTQQNKALTKKEGRPIFEDMEVVEVRFAGNRQTVSVFPAHAICGEMQDDEGDSRPMTYAERWPDQYKRFKAKVQQIASGTPVDELPFLTQAKRSELKALSIYTAEALAALDGNELKNLGQGGRELKNQAIAYLDNAKGSADVTRMAQQIEEMKQTIAELQAIKAPEMPAPAAESPFQEWPDDEIKDWIAERTGERPKGNPNHTTLVKRADEINSGLAEKAA